MFQLIGTSSHVLRLSTGLTDTVGEDGTQTSAVGSGEGGQKQLGSDSDQDPALMLPASVRERLRR